MCYNGRTNQYVTGGNGMDNTTASEKNTEQTPRQAQQPAYETIFCSTCGEKIAKTAPACPHCGAPVAQNQQQPQIVINNSNANTNTNQNIQQVNAGYWKKPKNKWVALLLCIFFGYLGAHKFYEGRTGMGILYLLTLGLCGIGWVIDILILLLKPNPYYV